MELFIVDLTMSVGWEWTDRDSCSSRTHVDKTTIRTSSIFYSSFHQIIFSSGEMMFIEISSPSFFGWKGCCGSKALSVFKISRWKSWIFPSGRNCLGVKTAGKLANYPRNWNSPPRSLLYSDRNNMRTIKGWWNKFNSKLADFFWNSIWCDVFRRLQLDKSC